MKVILWKHENVNTEYNNGIPLFLYYSKSDASEDKRNRKSQRKKKKDTVSDDERPRETCGYRDSQYLSEENTNEMRFNNYGSRSYKKSERERNTEYSNGVEDYRDRSDDRSRRKYHFEKENVNNRCEIFPKPFFKKIPFNSKYSGEFYLTKKEFARKMLEIEKMKNPFVDTKPLNSAKSFSLEVFDVRIVDKMKSKENTNISAGNESSKYCGNGDGNSRPIEAEVKSQSETLTENFSSLNINATPFCPNSYEQGTSGPESSLLASDFNIRTFAASNLPHSETSTVIKTRKGYLLNRGGFKKTTAEQKPPTNPRINEDLIQTLDDLDAQRLKNVHNEGVTEKPAPATLTVNDSNNIKIINAPPGILIPQALSDDLMISVAIPASKLADLREFVPEAVPFIFGPPQRIEIPAAGQNPNSQPSVFNAAQRIEIPVATQNTNSLLSVFNAAQSGEVPVATIKPNSQPSKLASEEIVLNTRRADGSMNVTAIVPQSSYDAMEISNVQSVTGIPPIPVTSMAVINQTPEPTEMISRTYSQNVPLRSSVSPPVPPVPVIVQRNSYRTIEPLVRHRSNFVNQPNFASIPYQAVDGSCSASSPPTSLAAQQFVSQSMTGNVFQDQPMENNSMSSQLVIDNMYGNQPMMTHMFNHQPMMTNSFENQPMFSDQVRLSSDQPNSITINVNDNYPFNPENLGSPSVSF